MSAVDDRETSISDSEPLELYRFFGSYKSYYYTSASEPVTFDGSVYVPIPGLERTSIKISSNSEENAALRVEMIRNADIIADYAYQTTPPRLLLDVIRVYRDLLPYESNFSIIWRGPVSNVSVRRKKATLDVPSNLMNVLGYACPSVYFQNQCNHVLYDPDTCGVPRVPNAVDTQVLSLVNGGQTIRLVSYGAFAPAEFVGGELLVPSQNERRMIIGATTDSLIVNYPFGRIGQGSSVQAVRGCDHAWMGHCKTRFNNTERFGGHPLVPKVNLFESGF